MRLLFQYCFVVLMLALFVLEDFMFRFWCCSLSSGCHQLLAVSSFYPPKSGSKIGCNFPL